MLHDFTSDAARANTRQKWLSDLSPGVCAWITLKENASEDAPRSPSEEMETRQEGSLDLNRRRVKAGPIPRERGTQGGDANGKRKVKKVGSSGRITG